VHGKTVERSASGGQAYLNPLVLDDEVRDWEGEAVEGGFRASLFKPGGVLVRECDDDEFIRREGAKRVLDRFHRVGITNLGLNVVGRRRLRKLVGPLGCVSAGVVLGVCQPVESGDAGGWRDDEYLCILARVRTDRRAQIGRGDRSSGDDEEPTRHCFSLSGSLTEANVVWPVCTRSDSVGFSRRLSPQVVCEDDEQ
jgi:hypothetical protein